MGSHPGQFPYCSWMVSYAGHGTKIMRGEGWYKSYQHEFISITCLSTGAARDPGHGTKIMRGEGWYKLLVMSIRFISQFLNPVPQGILVMAPELQEDGMVQVLFIGSISEFLKSSKIRKPGTTRYVTAPEIARGVPLPVYMNF